MFQNQTQINYLIVYKHFKVGRKFGNQFSVEIRFQTVKIVLDRKIQLLNIAQN